MRLRQLSLFLVSAFCFIAFTTTNAADASKAGACKSTQKNRPLVRLQTNHGVITLELDADKAPVSVANFVDYAKSGFYDGTLFHRIIDGFMIQGGGYDKTTQRKPTKAPIKNEASNGLLNNAYTVAMARTSDPNSATAQFFINVNDNTPLNFTSETPQGWGYAVFGKVVEGKDVVDKIKKVQTGNKNVDQQMMPNVPVNDVVIEKAQVCPL